MKKIHIVSILESHQIDGELFNPILQDNTPEGIVKKVNIFFDQEENEGHPVLDGDDEPVRFSDMKEIDGTTLTDKYGDREYVLSLLTIEVPTSYEAYTRSKIEDFQKQGFSKESAFAETFLDELNHQPFDMDAFARTLCTLHPTLQQLFFKLVKTCIMTRAAHTYSQDERNEASCRMCRELSPIAKRYSLPMK